MGIDLGQLEHTLGYKFNAPELIQRALTHRSWAHETLPKGDPAAIREMQNESLEFLGDSVLGLAVAEFLMQKHPTSSEGELTLMKHRLVSTELLARIAGTLELGKHLRIGRGEEKTGGRQKQALLADVMEAVIGAVFMDGGYIQARAFIQRILATEIRKTSPENAGDFKTIFQEKLQASKLSAPTYKLIETEGPPHARIFSVEATWNDGAAVGKGRSIKAAEMAAAEKGLGMFAKQTEGK